MVTGLNLMRLFLLHLYQLAEELPFTYAKLALQENGLQDFVDAINSLN